MEKYIQILKQTSQACAKKGVPCLESVFQQLLLTVDQLAAGDQTETESAKSLNLAIIAAPPAATTASTLTYRPPQNSHSHASFLQTNPLYGAVGHNQDYNVPYPRSSGARFCSAGASSLISHFPIQMLISSNVQYAMRCEQEC